MTAGWVLIALAFAYAGALFALAWFGDRAGQRDASGQGVARNSQGDDSSPGRLASGYGSAAETGRPFLYALSIAVFCTSWTFFGSVGLATTSGYSFMPVYLGPILAFALCGRLIRHIVSVSKGQNLTSVADLLSARYGRSQTLAVTATTISVIGTLPYIALQLKAIVLSVDVMVGPRTTAILPAFVDPALVAAVMLGLFAVLFGTRHTDATEHQNGMMLAVAVESVVKLAAFLAVGAFVLVTVFTTPAGFVTALREHATLGAVFGQGIHASTWITVTVLSFSAILLLPRQFHVTVVENRSPRELNTAVWLFPLYLIAINLFVVPVAAAGLLLLPKNTPGDIFVLALPQMFEAHSLAFVAFIGGLSAATAMVVVDTVALGIMISNSFFVPFLVKDGRAAEDVSQRLLMLRRLAIFAITLCGYGAYRLLATTQGLAGIGLVSFAAVAQLAPAFLAAFFWRLGTARGATVGMVVGFLVWFYTLVLPWFADAGLVSRVFMTEGPFGVALLAPERILGIELDRLSHGVLCSLAANLLTFVFVSMQRHPAQSVRQQAEVFSMRNRRAPAATVVSRGLGSEARVGAAGELSVRVSDVHATVTRFLGAERAARSFREYELHIGRSFDANGAADADLIRYAEYLLNSAVGAASARLIMTLLLRRGAVDAREAVQLLDAVPEALLFNRDLLQTALDQMRDGIAVFDRDMRLTWWNVRFRELLGLAPEFGQVGVPMQAILNEIGQSKEPTQQALTEFVNDRFYRLTRASEPYFEHLAGGRRIVEIRSQPMTVGGYVVSFADVTDRKLAADALETTNIELERRVAERTNALTELNRQLTFEKARADTASQDKTRFLAAASHDVMQPLHAARLYGTSLQDKLVDPEQRGITKNFLTSLDAVDEILTALTDIARIDSGRLDPEITAFPLGEVFDQLRIEFEPIAKSRGLTFSVVPTSLWVRSDRRLMRRVFQNLVSNGLKYTKKGGVVLGARRTGDGTPGTPGGVQVQVTDTGVGIPQSMRDYIFREFTRLPDVDATVRGIGLGLSIVERITRLMRHPLSVRSAVDKGSTFTVALPRVAAPKMTSSVSGASTAAMRKSSDFAASLPTLATARPAALDGTIVLVVDNDPLVLGGMNTILSGWNCTVHSVAGIRAALAVLYDGKVQPDVLVVDYHLDDGTGLDAIASIRVRLDSQIPAVIVTADTSPDLAREARLYGASLLRKPVKPAQLRAIINQLARQRALV